jgi:nucleotide-binding universal stress UspA family protein
MGRPLLSNVARHNYPRRNTMQEIRQIIVPVDFQQHTEELAEFAIGLATPLAATVIFFHVVERVVFYADFIPTNFSEQEKQTFDHANKKMSALVEKNKKMWLQCSGQVSKGDIVDAILEYSEEKGVDLIVMGTHGARGIEKILLGSVAERVIKRSSRPVLVFKPPKK